MIDDQPEDLRPKKGASDNHSPARAFESKAGPVAPSGLIARDFLADRCLNAKYPPADCRVCRDICPSDAIGFDGPNPSLSRDCIGCGLCVAACPQEALGDPFQTLRPKKDSPAEYCCSGLWAGGPEGQPNLPREFIPCLGSITFGTMLERLFGRTPAVRVLIGSCSGCAMAEGRKRFDRHSERLAALAGALGLSPCGVDVAAATESDMARARGIQRDFLEKRERERGYSRRDLFSGFRRALAPRPQPPTAAPAAAEAFDATRDERLDVPERILRYALAHRADISPETILPHFRRIDISAECNLCGVCARLCPSGAVFLKREDVRSSLFTDAVRCTGCGLCAAKCPRTAVRLADGLTAAEAAGGPRPVRSLEIRRCLDCRREFLAQGDEDYCLSCARVVRIREDVSNMIFGEE